jgi:hypothetical protein
MATLDHAAPTFLVPDVASTARWHETKLGFNASFHPKTPPYVCGGTAWRSCCCGRKATASRGSSARAECGTPYVRMKGLLGFYDEVRSRIALKSELTNRPYGDSEFEVEDRNGYVLVFGEILTE